jgi:hypothetical protein
VVRPHAFDQVAEEAAEAVQRIDGIAIRIGDRDRHRVPGAKHEHRGIDQIQRLLNGEAIV